jgi:hypothetical protein
MIMLQSRDYQMFMFSDTIVGLPGQPGKIPRRHGVGGLSVSLRQTPGGDYPFQIQTQLLSDSFASPSARVDNFHNGDIWDSQLENGG